MLISVDTFSTSARSLGGSVQFFCVDIGGAGVTNWGDGQSENKDRFRTPVQADARESLVMKSHPKEFWTTEKDKYIII